MNKRTHGINYSRKDKALAVSIFFWPRTFSLANHTSTQR